MLLEEAPLPAPQGEKVAKALADGVRQLGLAVLPFSKAANN